MSIRNIRTIVLSLVGLMVLAVALGFLYLPNFFTAKYDGRSLTTADGKKLVTIVRLPDGNGPFPTLVVRSPYELPHTPLSGMPSEDFADVADKDLGQVGWKPVTDAGYALVIQHTRGRIGSEGVALDTKDREDSIELLSWVRAQPWSNGKIGTTGDSIEAITAMITNAGYTEGVDASYVQIGAPNLINEVMFGPGGALKLETFLPWTAEQILTADKTHFDEIGYGPIARRLARLRMMRSALEITSDMEKPHALDAWTHLPLKDYPVFSEVSEGWNAMLDARPGSELADHFDASVTDVPTYYVAAWLDVFASSQLSAFARAEARGVDQRLLVINGTHFVPEDPGAWPIQPMLPWFDFHLKGKTSAFLDLPRVIFSIANMRDEWFGTETWPPAASTTFSLALSADGELVEAVDENAVQGLREFTYDPDNPVPTIGGRNLLITNGALDQSAVRQAQRLDVLSYDGPTLAEDLLIAGPVSAHLSISSDAPDTDFTVKILDVSPDGQAMLVTEGIQRARFRSGLDRELFLESGKVYDLAIDLGHIAWRFKAGHRIGVDVSSSNFPQWDRNLNTDDPLFSNTRRRIANNTVHHGLPNVSRIELPVVEDDRDLTRLPHFKTFRDQ